MNDDRDSYRILSEALPYTRAWLEPKRFVLPQAVTSKYPHPGSGFLFDLGRVIASLGQMKSYSREMVSGGNYHIVDSGAILFAALHLLKQNNFPTYFIGEDIGAAIGETEPPGDTPIEDIRSPYPAFNVWLPKGMLTLGKGRVERLTIAFLKQEIAISIDRQMVEEIRSRYATAERPPYWQSAVTVQAPASIYIEAQIEGESPVEVFTAWDAETLGKLVQNFRAIGGGSETFPQSDAEALLRLAVNIVMVLGWVPDEVGEETLVRKAQANRKGEITKTELWEPRFIGRPVFRTPRPATSGTGDGPDRFDEVRRAHWKRQAYGPAHSLRKVIWVSLYRTRSREDRGLPPE